MASQAFYSIILYEGAIYSEQAVSVDASLCCLKCEGINGCSPWLFQRHPLSDAKKNKKSICFLDSSSDAAFHACCLFVGGRNGSMTHLPCRIGHNYLMCRWRNAAICLCECFEKALNWSVILSVLCTHTGLWFTVIPQQPIHPYHTAHPISYHNPLQRPILLR